MPEASFLHENVILVIKELNTYTRQYKGQKNLCSTFGPLKKKNNNKILNSS